MLWRKERKKNVFFFFFEKRIEIIFKKEIK